MKTDSAIDLDPERLGGAFRHRPDPTGGEPPIDQIVSLLDLQDAAPPVQRLRRWALDLVRVRPGERVVDVGSGTGTVASLLAGLVGPAGRVSGVEPYGLIRAEAVRRARVSGSAATFVGGVAGALPFRTGSVDLVWCERVLQHLDDPHGAIAEIARVLRPGGRAVLLDSDHASRVTADLDPSVEARLNQAFLDSSPNPRAARHIPRQAAAVGLVLDDDIGSAALIMPQWVQREGVLLRRTAAQAVRDGLVSGTEAQDAIDALRSAAEEGVSFSAVTMFGFVARAP